MAPLNAFENRRDEAFEKIMELITEGQEKADYIAIDEIKQEMVTRYMWLAQQGWSQFFHKEIRTCPLCDGGLHYLMTWEGHILHFTCKECDSHITLDMFEGMNQSSDRIYEVVRGV